MLFAVNGEKSSKEDIPKGERRSVVNLHFDIEQPRLVYRRVVSSYMMLLRQSRE